MDVLLSDEQTSIERLVDLALKPYAAKPLSERGPNDLTKSQFDVLRLILLGLNNKEIAYRRFTAVKSVKFHVTSIYKKLGYKNRHQLIPGIMFDALNKGVLQ